MLYIRNLALGATQGAVEELDRRKKQIVQRLVDLGPSTVEGLGKALQLNDTDMREVLSELEKEGIVALDESTVSLSA